MDLYGVQLTDPTKTLDVGKTITCAAAQRTSDLAFIGM